ncbi:potassium-transporting ATPase subunit C [Rugamonas rubra]|uniref:K+-transporting ATPase, c chain n=1 Tax=Rugamonas rubra TaxID=758825 RepID=A0A1I4HVT6_9BURK|nr:potassium-transporting ATPase subunit C [Rugamonas rubra]SFL45751.1 K+-transporting ATPase, c chain [Rugamonas rubra]
MKTHRCDSGTTVPPKRRAPPSLARRTGQRLLCLLCLAAALWAASAVAQLTRADAPAPARQRSQRELPPPPPTTRLAQLYFQAGRNGAPPPGHAAGLELSAAHEQVARVAATRRASPTAVASLLAASVAPQPAGRVGEPRVSLLALNLALDLQLPAPH